MAGWAALADFAKDAWAQNMANDRQEDSQSFNAEQAAIQRHWEETMSNTQYQRRTKDLIAADMNPMLAYTTGPGTTPSGAAAQSSPAGNPGHSSFAGGMASASQVSVNQAQEELIRAQAAKTKAEEAEIQARTPTHAVSIDVMRQNISESETRIKNIMQQTRTGEFSAQNIEQQTRNLQEAIPQIRATVEQIRAHTKLTGSQTTLAGAQTAQAHAQTGLAKAETTKVGEQTSDIKQRVSANLPALENALKELERQAKILQMPGRHQEAAVSEGYMGALAATLRALNPFSDFVKAR